MKLLFNQKYNIALLLCLVILAVLFLSKKKKEGYDSRSANRQSINQAQQLEDGSVASDYVKAQKIKDTQQVDEANAAITGYRRKRIKDKYSDFIGVVEANKFNTFASKKITKYGDKVSSFLDDIASVIIQKHEDNSPKSRDVYGNGTDVPDTITTGLKPDTSLILTSGCSNKSILRSDFADDICMTYFGDYEAINEKCNQLSNDNCNLPACCVLVNGTKCVAGDANGPTYLTDQGNEIDYNYYLFRNKCYGAGCKDAQNTYQKKCGAYADNSTKVSQDCMVQMFNDAGCTSANPIYVVDDTYAYNNSKSSKKYIEGDLQTIAKSLMADIAKGYDDSRIKCKPDPTNPCDDFLSTGEGISKACMIKMYNDAACPTSATNCMNKAPALISDQFVSDYSRTDKNNIKRIIDVAAKAI